MLQYFENMTIQLLLLESYNRIPILKILHHKKQLFFAFITH